VQTATVVGQRKCIHLHDPPSRSGFVRNNEVEIPCLHAIVGFAEDRARVLLFFPDLRKQNGPLVGEAGEDVDMAAGTDPSTAIT